MRKHLALLLALLFLAGCGAPAAEPTAPDPEPAAETVPTPSETPAALAWEQDAGLDPYQCRSVCNRLVLERIYEPLFRVTGNCTAEPVLAEGYTVSDDGMTTTIRLRPDVTFHNGASLTAADAADSILRAKAGAYYAGRFDLLAGAEAKSANTLVLTTSAAYETLPLLLDVPIAPAGADLTEPIGTGPYRWQNGALERFDGWWDDRDLPERIALRPVAAAAEQRDAFQYGGVGLTVFDPNCDGAVGYGGDYELWSMPTSVLQFVGFRLDGGVFADGGLRAAVTCAVDREAIVTEDMGGFGVSAPLAVLPGSPWYLPELAGKVTYDPPDLRAFAPAEGEIVMIVNADGGQRVTTAHRIAESLTVCGLPVTVRELSPGRFSEALQNGDFDLYYGQIRLPPDLDLRNLFHAGYGGLDGYSSLTELVDLTRANSGNAYDLQQAILTDGIFCPVVFETYAVCAKRGLFPNLTPHLNGWIQ